MIRIGIIGTGGMARWHVEQAKKIKGVTIVSGADVSEERVKAFCGEHGIPKYYTDYREMIAREKLDGICNVTPDSVHAEVAIAAARKGLHILGEKPLAVSLAEARRMLAEVKKAGVVNLVNFSYRNSCALQGAAQFIARGGIGKIKHVESSYLQSWLNSFSWDGWKDNPARLWRLSTKHGSAGVLGDLGCHIYDLTTLLAGDIATIDCRLKCFDKGVRNNRSGEYVFDANDSFISTVEFANGAIGVIHSSRWATGHANSLRARVYGDKGGVEIDLDSGWDKYRVCTGVENMKSHTWTTVVAKPTPNNWERFVRAVRTGKNDPNDFENGVKIQAYLHYSFASDAAGKPVKVKY